MKSKALHSVPGKAAPLPDNQCDRHQAESQAHRQPRSFLVLLPLCPERSLIAAMVKRAQMQAHV